MDGILCEQRRGRLTKRRSTSRRGNAFAQPAGSVGRKATVMRVGEIAPKNPGEVGAGRRKSLLTTGL
jgi:hypothetical protein